MTYSPTHPQPLRLVTPHFDAVDSSTLQICNPVDPSAPLPLSFESSTPKGEKSRKRCMNKRITFGDKETNSESNYDNNLSSKCSGQQFGQNPASGSQVPSPPKAALNKSSFEPGDKETNSDLSKSKAALVVTGKGSAQGSGRGSFLYGRAQVMGASGNLGSGHGDQNFPTFFPVMQFQPQHPGSIGVPAVGMAFPGYVAQPQFGLGKNLK